MCSSIPAKAFTGTGIPFGVPPMLQCVQDDERIFSANSGNAFQWRRQMKIGPEREIVGMSRKSSITLDDDYTDSARNVGQRAASECAVCDKYFASAVSQSKRYWGTAECCEERHVNGSQAPSGEHCNEQLWTFRQ